MNSKTKTPPIRIKNKLKDLNGRIWEVYETYPGGHVELIDRERCRTMSTYKNQLNDWTRI